MAETNYRVYAYTDSSLQIALLGLFTEIMYRCRLLYNVHGHSIVQCYALLYNVVY